MWLGCQLVFCGLGEVTPLLWASLFSSPANVGGRDDRICQSHLTGGPWTGVFLPKHLVRNHSHPSLASGVPSALIHCIPGRLIRQHLQPKASSTHGGRWSKWSWACWPSSLPDAPFLGSSKASSEWKPHQRVVLHGKAHQYHQL